VPLRLEAVVVVVVSLVVVVVVFSCSCSCGGRFSFWIPPCAVKLRAPSASVAALLPPSSSSFSSPPPCLRNALVPAVVMVGGGVTGEGSKVDSPSVPAAGVVVVAMICLGLKGRAGEPSERKGGGGGE